MSDHRSLRPKKRLGPELPRAILFDMDDTIFDHSMTCRAALGQLRGAERLLRRMSLEALWREYSRLLDAIQPDIFAGRLTIQQARVERFQRLARMCGREVSPDEAQEFSRRYRASYQELRRLVPGVRRLLERLHGRAVIGVVTNNEVAEQEGKLDFFGIRSLIDFMIVSEGVGVSKPEPGIFRLALDRAGATANETVMVGDSWRSDVMGARNVGIRPVWFNRFHLTRPDPLPVPELDSFHPPAAAESVLAALGSDGLPTG